VQELKHDGYRLQIHVRDGSLALAQRKVLRRTKRGIQYVEHVEGHGAEIFKAICDLGLERIVFKKINSPYRSGPSKSWIKVKNPKAAGATRVLDGTF
jgi:ATP-dependent DNA ligase